MAFQWLPAAAPKGVKKGEKQTRVGAAYSLQVRTELAGSGLKGDPGFNEAFTAGLVPIASDGFTSAQDCCLVPSCWDPMSHGACVTAVGPTVLQVGGEN